MFISDDHAETSTVATVLSSGRNGFCVRRAGGSSLPPVTADLRTTASIALTGASRLTFNGIAYFYGVTFHVGSTTDPAPIRNGSNTPTYTIIEDGLLEFANSGNGNTTNGSVLELANAGSFPSELWLINTPVKFGSDTSQGIWPSFGSLHWIDTPSAVQGTAPAKLIKAGSANGIGGLVEIRGCDLSAVTAMLIESQNGTAPIVIADCKVAVGVNLYDTGTGRDTRSDAGYVRIDNCDDATGNKNYRFLEVRQGGSIASDAIVYRTSGASDGVTSYCWLMLGSGAATIFLPLLSRRIAQRNSATGSALTATVEIIVNNSAALTDAQVWLEVEALTSAASPISTFGNDRVANLLPSTTAAAQATSSATWNAPLRANSTAYALGAAITVASNPGRVFFCTTAGTTAGSEPAGYASAVDGGSVTDNTATFRAGFRQKIAVGFTPQKAGFVFGVVQLAANSISVYVDPKLTIA